MTKLDDSAGYLIIYFRAWPGICGVPRSCSPYACPSAMGHLVFYYDGHIRLWISGLSYANTCQIESQLRFHVKFKILSV